MKHFAFFLALILLAVPVAAKPVTVTTKIELKQADTILKNGVTLINAEILLKPLGGSFTRLEGSGTYKIACRNHNLTIQLGSTNYTIDGKPGSFTLMQVPFLNRGRLMVPARKMTELLGGKVDGKTLVFNKTLLKDIIFLHHSCGQNWIADGEVRQKLTKAGFQFWDHGYNGDGLTDPNGKKTGKNYSVPGDNTNPDGYAGIFSQKLTKPPTNTLSHLLDHDLIIIKSCFPVSDISSDDMLEEYFGYYKTVKAGMKKYPGKVFIIVTQPPLNRKATTPDRALRARKLANFLKSSEFLKDAPNVSTFDWFDLLAVSDTKSPYYSMLKPEYSPEGDDSHPNFIANFNTSPAFVAHVVSKAVKY